MNMEQMLEFRLAVQNLIQTAECDCVCLGRWAHAPDADGVLSGRWQADRVIADKTAYVKKEILDEEG